MDGWDIMVRMVFPFSRPFPQLDFSMLAPWLTLGTLGPPSGSLLAPLGSLWAPFGSLLSPFGFFWRDYEHFHKFHTFS
jgi:hypothetical protein